jgi:hypothetical protein
MLGDTGDDSLNAPWFQASVTTWGHYNLPRPIHWKQWFIPICPNMRYPPKSNKWSTASCSQSKECHMWIYVGQMPDYVLLAITHHPDHCCTYYLNLYVYIYCIYLCFFGNIWMVYTLVYTYSDINTHHFVIIIHIIGSLYIYIVNGINMYVYIYISLLFLDIC